MGKKYLLILKVKTRRYFKQRNTLNDNMNVQGEKENPECETVHRTINHLFSRVYGNYAVLEKGVIGPENMERTYTLLNE